MRDSGYADRIQNKSLKNSLRDDNHFKQFFGGNQVNTINGRYNSSNNRNLFEQQIDQAVQGLNKDKIDLDSFGKFIQTTPQNQHNTIKTNNNSTSISRISTNKQQQQQQQQPLAGPNLSFEASAVLGNNNDSKVTSFLNNKSSLTQSNTQNNISNTQQQLQLNRSYFFNGPERFIQDINLNYFDHSDINPLVDTKKTYQPGADLEYSKISERPARSFSTSKLYLSSVGLRTSKEMKSELEEVKANLELRRQYNEEKDRRNRGYKLTKAAFRSGITHLDGPQEPDTKIYFQENNKFLGRQSEEDTRRKARLTYIEKYVTTNPAIVFDNISRTKFDAKNPMNFPHHVDEFSNGFLAKQKNPQATQYNSKSFDRLFGHNLADQKQTIGSARSKYLFSKDAYGKQQNIISNTVNTTLQYVQ